MESELGNYPAAKQDVTAALALSPGLWVQSIAAIALARAGETARARALIDELENKYPANSLLKFYWLPSAEAAIQVNRTNASRAIADLEVTAPYELISAGNLYPAYIHGQAYLLAHNGVAAASEFQKILDHRGIVTNFVLGALAHLQLGRAYAIEGESAKAKSAYQDFFSLWKDADTDIPVLKRARAEYAKLQ
jgi:hypothetical protein